MATSYELVRDDNAKWVTCGGRKTYRNAGTTNRSLPMPVALDLRYTAADLGDQDDRRTSSCSPESCELAYSETAFKTQRPFDQPLQPSGACKNFADTNDMQCSVIQGHVQNWPVGSSDEVLRTSQSAQPVNRRSSVVPYPLVNSNVRYFNNAKVHEESKLTSGIKSSKRKFHRNSNFNEPPTYEDSVKYILLRENIEKQNGVVPLRGDTETRLEAFPGSKNNVPRVSPTLNLATSLVMEKEVRESFPKLTPNALSPQNTVHGKLHKRSRNEGFGENDAAEALLVLSESFYQTSKSDSSSSISDSVVHNNADVTAPSTNHHTSVSLQNSDHACQPSSNLESKPLDSLSTQDHSVPVTNITESRSCHKHSKLHFKKFICQKFVNSLDRPKDENSRPQTPPIPVCDALSPRFNLQNGGAKNVETVQSDEPCEDSVRSATPTSEGTKDVVNMDTQPLLNEPENRTTLNNEINENFLENVGNKQTLSLQSKNKESKSETNVSLVEKEQSDVDKKLVKPVHSETTLDLELIVPSLNPKNDLSRNIDLSPAQSKISNDKKSNLYRVSTSLGSSSESLYATDDDLCSDHASESSSDSSDAESEEYEQQTSNTVTKAFSAEEQPTPKRKTFVLSRPKFSLPCKENIGKETSTHLRTSHQNSRNNPLLVSPASKVECSVTTCKDALLPRNNSNQVMEPTKQNTIHIKKATFTFSSSDKQDKTSRQSGLKVTSQHCDSVERAQYNKNVENSFKFDKEKLDVNEPYKAKQSSGSSETWTSELTTFGECRGGDTFEALSKPENMDQKPIKEKISALDDEDDDNNNTLSSANTKYTPPPYDKHRLPRPSARSPALEAPQTIKCKPGRKRKLPLHRENVKQTCKHVQKRKIIKCSKSSTDVTKKTIGRPAVQNPNTTVTSEKKTKQNGDTVVDTNISSGTLGLPKSTSRRKPARVFKHEKYTATSVSKMSSTDNARNFALSEEFAIIRRPLNLDHRVLLANSIDPDRYSLDNCDGIHSSSVTSSSSSSRTSSVAGDDYDSDVSKKVDMLPPDNHKQQHKRHRHRSAVENTIKSDLLKRKNKLKRLLSVTDQQGRGQAMRLLTTNMLHNPARTRDQPSSGPKLSFRLLAHFPAPASLRPGHAFGELLPGYGPSVSGQRSTLPLRWKKGEDVTDVKQKRQRVKWRNMTLDMFCMGMKS